MQIEAGTGKNKNPIRVLAPLDMLIFSGWVCLFRVEYGADGSLYVKPTPKAGEYVVAKSIASNGFVQFDYSKFEMVDKEIADKHPYISFHSTGAINHPGHTRGGVFNQQMTISLEHCSPKHEFLCWQSIGALGSYEWAKPPQENDCVFNCFDAWANRSGIPIVVMDVASFPPEQEVAKRVDEIGYRLVDKKGVPRHHLIMKFHIVPVVPGVEYPRSRPPACGEAPEGARIPIRMRARRSRKAEAGTRDWRLSALHPLAPRGTALSGDRRRGRQGFRLEQGFRLGAFIWCGVWLRDVVFTLFLGAASGPACGMR